MILLGWMVLHGTFQIGNQVSGVFKIKYCIMFNCSDIEPHRSRGQECTAIIWRPQGDQEEHRWVDIKCKDFVAGTRLFDCVCKK